jgi:hypothetical protein
MITVLTEPIPTKRFYFLRKIKSFLRPILRSIDGKEPLIKPKYGGHFGVTRSLIEGLLQINVKYNYNPSKTKKLFNIVVVLAGLDTLKQAIEFKKKNKILYLFAGPNLVILPTDSPQLIGELAIDELIVNSNWIKFLYKKSMPLLSNNMIVWPAGVNENYWSCINSNNAKYDLIFYYKNTNENEYNRCLKIAKRIGFNVTEIKYGSYKIEEYKLLLTKNSGLVHFSNFESQGLSLLESWSMNVPTFVLNPGFYDADGINVVCSSAPYLTEMTGKFFKNEIEFEDCLSKFKNNYYNFQPREWVLKNMTDSISAKNLLEQISKFI